MNDPLSDEYRTPLFGFPMMGEDGTITATFIPRALRFDCRYYDGKEFGLVFQNVAGYRFRRGPYTTSWHRLHAVDQLVVIRNSRWLRELRTDLNRPTPDQEMMSHFMFYASDHGCYEVLAEAYEISGAEVLPPDES